MHPAGCLSCTATCCSLRHTHARMHVRTHTRAQSTNTPLFATLAHASPWPVVTTYVNFQGRWCTTIHSHSHAKGPPARHVVGGRVGHVVGGWVSPAACRSKERRCRWRRGRRMRVGHWAGWASDQWADMRLALLLFKAHSRRPAVVLNAMRAHLMLFERACLAHTANRPWYRARHCRHDHPNARTPQRSAAAHNALCPPGGAPLPHEIHPV